MCVLVYSSPSLPDGKWVQCHAVCCWRCIFLVSKDFKNVTKSRICYDEWRECKRQDGSKAAQWSSIWQYLCKVVKQSDLCDCNRVRNEEERSQRNESRKKRWEERPKVEKHPLHCFFSFPFPTLAPMLNPAFCGTLTNTFYLHFKTNLPNSFIFFTGYGEVPDLPLRPLKVSDRDVDLISTDTKDLKVSAWISHCSQTNVESRGRKGVGDCRGGRDRVRRKMGFETWGGVSTEQLPNGPTMTRTCVIMQTLWRIDGGKWSLLSSMCFCAHPPARFKTSLCTLSLVKPEAWTRSVTRQTPGVSWPHENG